MNDIDLAMQTLRDIAFMSQGLTSGNVVHRSRNIQNTAQHAAECLERRTLKNKAMTLFDFRQEAQERLSDHAKEIDILKLSLTEKQGVFSFVIIAYLDNHHCVGMGDSAGKAIDRCIAAKAAYQGSVEKVGLNS